MLFSSLLELKSILEIDPADTQEDKNLLLFNSCIGDWFKEILGYDIFYGVRTQYYDGTSTQKLTLRNRPVYPTTAPNASLPFTAITINYDQNGFYGEGASAFGSGSNSTNVLLTFGTDYMLKLDMDPTNTGTDYASRSGVLLRVNDYWLQPIVRQIGLLSPFVSYDTGSYKITYSAGHTTDTLPAQIVMAANMAIARLRYIWPLGVELGGEGYEERSISLMADLRQYCITPTVRSMLFTYRNWKW